MCPNMLGRHRLDSEKFPSLAPIKQACLLPQSQDDQLSCGTEAGTVLTV
jgi:hypothetical protein